MATKPGTRWKEVATIKKSINLHNMKKKLWNSTIHVIYDIIEQPSLNFLNKNWIWWPLSYQNCNYTDLSKSIDNLK